MRTLLIIGMVLWGAHFTPCMAQEATHFSEDDYVSFDVSTPQNSPVLSRRHHTPKPERIVPDNTWGVPSFLDAQHNLIEEKLFNIQGIVLFDHANALRQIVGNATKTPMDHVAFDLVDQTHQHYLYEATGSMVHLNMRKLLPQVQLRIWDGVSIDYTGNVWYRSFRFADAYKPDTQHLTQMIHDYLGRSYDTDMFYVFGQNQAERNQLSVTTGQVNVSLYRMHPRAKFCSELVALMMKHLGYLPSSMQPHHAIPSDFFKTHNEKSHHKAPFLQWQNVMLDDPVKIVSRFRS